MPLIALQTIRGGKKRVEEELHIENHELENSSVSVLRKRVGWGWRIDHFFSSTMNKKTPQQEKNLIIKDMMIENSIFLQLKDYNTAVECGNVVWCEFKLDLDLTILYTLRGLIEKHTQKKFQFLNKGNFPLQHSQEEKLVAHVQSQYGVVYVTECTCKSCSKVVEPLVKPQTSIFSSHNFHSPISPDTSVGKEKYFSFLQEKHSGKEKQDYIVEVDLTSTGDYESDANITKSDETAPVRAEDTESVSDRLRETVISSADERVSDEERHPPSSSFSPSTIQQDPKESLRQDDIISKDEPLEAVKQEPILTDNQTEKIIEVHIEGLVPYPLSNFDCAEMMLCDLRSRLHNRQMVIERHRFVDSRGEKVKLVDLHEEEDITVDTIFFEEKRVCKIVMKHVL